MGDTPVGAVPGSAEDTSRFGQDLVIRYLLFAGWDSHAVTAEAIVAV